MQAMHRPSLALLALLAVATASAQTATFEHLGEVDEFSSSVATGVSPDGKVVVGYRYWGTVPDRERSFRWREHQAPQGLGWIDGAVDLVISDLSRNGNSIVGAAYMADGRILPVRWHEGNKLGTLEGFDLVGPNGAATGISDKGDVICGVSSWDNGDGTFQISAVRWDRFGTSLLLPSAPQTMTQASAVSGDGKVFVGFAGQEKAARWVNGQAQFLGGLDSSNRAGATATNYDGSVVVGRSANRIMFNGEDIGLYEAFYWKAGVMQPIGYLPTEGGLFPESYATAVTDDGNLVVGDSYKRLIPQSPSGGTIQYAPFVWDPAHGIRDLQQLLTTKYGLAPALQGWTLLDAEDVSANGEVIVGSALNPAGRVEAIVLRLSTRPDRVD